MLKPTLLTALAAAAILSAGAQSNAPVIKVLPAEYSRISDNGKWAVAQRGSQVDGSLAPSGGTKTTVDSATSAALTSLGLARKMSSAVSEKDATESSEPQ